MALDRQVFQFMDRAKSASNNVRIDSNGSYNTDNRCMRLGSNTPDMEIGNACVAWPFDQVVDFFGYMIVGRIEEDRGSVTHKAPGPASDHHGSHDTHDRVHPHPAKIAARQKSRDCQHGGERVSEDMHIGRTQIVVAAMGVMVVCVAMMVMLMAMMMATR